MFGMIWYRTKVLSVLSEQFGYKPDVPGMQSEIFNSVTRQIKKQGGNEYDGAIGFMLVLTDSMQSDTNKEVLEWKTRITQIAHSLMPKGRIGNQLFRGD